VKTASGSIPANNLKTHYTVSVGANLSLSTPADITSTTSALNVAIAEVKSIYTDMTTPKTSTSLGTGTGTAPAYITAQIANYNLALQRLEGSSSSSSGASSSSIALSILGG
jgi:hypothetical protein